jgi:predicted TIM-barrel fold metal-dependent hydrolase
MGIRSALQISGGQHDIEWIKQTQLAPADLDKAVKNNIAIMDKVGTDMQILSPRPFSLMHSHRRFKDVDVWVRLQNDMIHENVKQYPTRFRGIAGLPQLNGKPVEIVFDELHRCIETMGFVGVLVNPDPSEGLGTSPPTNIGTPCGKNWWHWMYPHSYTAQGAAGGRPTMNTLPRKKAWRSRPSRIPTYSSASRA